MNFFCLFVFCLLYSGKAFSAGTYFSERGVRALSRGGAFIAAPNDLSAIYLNPAGLTQFTNEISMDFAILDAEVDYQRTRLVSQRDPNTDEVIARYEVKSKSVNGQSTPLPFPSASVSHVWNDIHFAAGSFTPYVPILRYPQGSYGNPSPQRYSLYNLDNSALGTVGLWAAKMVSPTFSVGIGLQALIGKISSYLAVATNLPNHSVCASENPDCDTEVRVTSDFIFSPTANVGLTYQPSDNIKVGLSYQLPTYIKTPITFDTQMPSHPLLSDSYLSSNKGGLSLSFPWILRGGIECRHPLFTWEVAATFEAWRDHNKLMITSGGSKLKGIPSMESYDIADFEIDMGTRNTYSLRTGVEAKSPHPQLILRSGISYERAAVKKEYLSVQNIDVDKIPLSIGGSWLLENSTIDFVYSYIFMPPVTVQTKDAKKLHLRPVRGNYDDKEVEPINAGSYSVHAQIIGFAYTYRY